MNAERAQLGAGTSSETSDSENYEPGSPAAAQWGEALTDARAGATNPASSQDQVLASWAAEEGRHADEDRQQAVSRTMAWQQEGDLNETLDLSSLSLTALPASLPAGLRRLNVDDNQLTSVTHNLPAGLQRLYASNNRLTSLPELPAALRRLYAISNGLTSMPANLPRGLRRLNVTNNQLTSLPVLPANLRELDASGNRLTSLPDLPAELERLNVDYNQLANLPELPAGLEWLSANNNQLSSLPASVPPDLLWLGASNNQITSVPATLMTQLGRDSSVDLENNPLPGVVQTNLATAMHSGDYAGPQIFFSMAEGVLEVEPRPLHEVVADWLEGQPDAVVAWQGFAQEPGAQDYARFLDRLRGTVNSRNDAFRQAVVDDLQRVAVRPQLREQFFQLAFAASESCEDRITLTWNGMRTARLNADVQDGAYDGRLDELLQHGRVMFRLEALNEIARETVNSLRRADPEADIDEIEVYLAYQTQLREPLELRHIAPDMRFLNVSHVTEDDVARAEMSVRRQEATGFADYLATRWQPWESAVRRIAPQEEAAMQERLVDAMDDEFRTRLQQRLADYQLSGDNPASSSTPWLHDAERQLGAEIRNEIAREIKTEVMHRVLRDRGLSL
ncbi:NEL-type E3 ubiquitin ligase domain-containing protein [Bradyrhizobium sp. CB82]|uniref:NEL-type E3 ubiquitin ligase domain-containing protein n=1 Tax=Bradyrhizobium sp. CB82 TaxID=3039159 RepID=UPI0024B0DFD1|nr:NEL-type E3 ubiquitin ligase domain-containing protein [Bradyrhizobium sp. CB82]WFU40308.1 NEL-type E3 ubiquitin ligase domain-containing protein [Bradyrhizobium sp. CB82]